MEFNEYQEQALKTAIYPTDKKIIYPALGLAGETGEVCEKIKKVYRDANGEFTPAIKTEIAKELGDVLWYISAIASDLDTSLDCIANLNILKLSARKIDNKIHGSGDNR